MKTLILSSLVVISHCGCTLASSSDKVTPEVEVASNKPPINTIPCEEKNYQHKSYAELASMTPQERFEQAVDEQFFHTPDLGDYESLTLEKLIRGDGAKIFPILTENIDTFSPKNASSCDQTRFFVAHTIADTLDRSVVRLRGTKDGRATIAALEGAVKRMREAGYENGENREKSELNYTLLHLKSLMGVNLTDQSVSDTFWIKRRIRMSDEEVAKFSDFLTNRDPTYPTWSKIDFVTDNSRHNEAGNALQVYIFQDVNLFWESYREFKRGKSKAKHTKN